MESFNGGDAEIIVEEEEEEEEEHATISGNGEEGLETKDEDNYNLLKKIRSQLNSAGYVAPKVEVRFENLTVKTQVHIGKRALPTLANNIRDSLEQCLTASRLLPSKKQSLTILNNISGIVRPGRMTLLLGPPGSGKSTLMLALAGKLQLTLKTSGTVTYNGELLGNFVARRTSAYISQTDNHIGELTVRESLDFAARCQGASDIWAGCASDQAILEAEREMDVFTKASSLGRKHNLATEYVMRVLGLDACADTIVGNDMVRGISGGQKKRVTTGEMVIGPRKTLFMDEISTGLDASTTFQIVKCIRNFAHIMEGTVLMALLQPAPETFELFDDIILLCEGQIIYQGPRTSVVDFFQSLGFKLPPRKDVADFLLEVTSLKDQGQYWADDSQCHMFLSTNFSDAFEQSEYGRVIQSTLSVSDDKANMIHSALAHKDFDVSKWELFKACFAREVLLVNRHRTLYFFRACDVAFVGLITCTMYLQTRNHANDEINGNLYLSCLFFGLLHMIFNAFSETSMLISRLPVFYKQRDNLFYPAWAFSIPSWILRIPFSIIQALIWSCIVYYSVGFAPDCGRYSLEFQLLSSVSMYLFPYFFYFVSELTILLRFFRFVFLYFSVHQMALGLFVLLAALAQDMIAVSSYAAFSNLLMILLGGFILPRGSLKPWLNWGYWISPLSYGQMAASANEFSAPRWMKKSTVRHNILQSHGMPEKDYWYWLGVGVLLAFNILFNALSIMALSYLYAPGKSHLVIPSDESAAKVDGSHSTREVSMTVGRKSTRANPPQRMILPFQPLTMTFHDVNYYVDVPKGGSLGKKLQILSNVSGVFRPGVLTALVGASGAGKTTLLDVLAGRKTSGYIEGDIRISGHLKEQKTFARISGYVEQSDIHSPNITVEESLQFSSWLRLPKEATSENRLEFVEEVMNLVELHTLRHALVGISGSTGLSTEQRKRLTIAVELVANPSIIFMDEPTSGLDARAAALVMRAIRKTADTGRTVVCTVHQPSIVIFEAFDELLLLKQGGQVIFGGPLGEHSQLMINYFQAIPGVPAIRDGYNPATWILEICTQACKQKISLDFASIYQNSDQYREIEGLIKDCSIPVAGSEPLKFSLEFSQGYLMQFKLCFWKINLAYWRNPPYNVVRFYFSTICGLILGSVFWNIGSKRDTIQDVSNIMGALYLVCMFLGVNNATSIQSIVYLERTVYYRESSSGMYSPFPFAAAQALVEIPYVAIQTMLFGCTTYFMIGFERTIVKFLKYLIVMYLTFLYFTFYGMMAVGVSSSQHLAATFASTFYSIWNLLSGFLIPKARIPVWWIWFHYICPVAWTLRGIVSSQLGDVESELVGPGFRGTVKEYLKIYLDYDSSMISVSIYVLVAFSFFFFAMFAVSIRFLNYQKR
ncbi:ABC transporter G family member 31 isoform X3 [Amborella trichopoda]|uniref:ABC transporter G family member 31 isoform X3 n=1 Tax=Amborella trichopoda TaxID=13333 RepID=UPI0009BEA9A7|nr:ABC transporter G family member 31 isoform X3 [Amborella trichopoda]|eukprot:XP_020518878.1 ABC transporter G family member 31 isoform X3 [Amborella trichopoda]